MTIGIDIRVLASKYKSGIEEYTENLLSHILPLDSNINFKLFFSSLWPNSLPNYPWLSLPNVVLKKFRRPNKILFSSSRLFNYPKLDILLGGTDVFFSPHFLLASLSAKCKRVTTFHDLSYLRFPEFLSWRRKIWHYFEMKPSWQSKFSDKIIAVSQSTKYDLVENYGIDPIKISVIYSGVSPQIKRPSQDKLERFKRDKNLPEKFILFLGKLEPRKNIVGVIQSFNLFKKIDGFEDVHLVIVGSKGWLYKDIFKEVNRSTFKSQIIIRNFISDEERPFYYSLASVFIYPSFFEGFGFPPLEAMACMVPVIISNNSSIPEVVGDSGLLIDAYSISDLVRSLKSVLVDSHLRKILIKRGLERSSKFTWEKTAESTLRLLTSL